MTDEQNGRPTIRLSPEYSADWPLWGEGAERDDLPLSPALTARLDEWNDLFQRHFHWDGGWQDLEARGRFRREAPRLVRDLQRELPGVDVEFVDWTEEAGSRRERRRRRAQHT